jgi:hypothetical protein
MAFLEKDDIPGIYTQAVTERREWQKDYDEYQRLADNGLMAMFEDENLPDVNDGSLAASLFKLPKQIINRTLKGRAKVVDRDESWLTELANITWERIVKKARTLAPFHRKWKHAVRVSAIFGSAWLVTLMVERGNYTGADVIVANPGDVTLEPGKVSDEDSDIIFYDVYYTKLQLQNIIESAKREAAEAKAEGRPNESKWYLPELEAILEEGEEEDRNTQDTHGEGKDKAVKRSGFHFYIAFQRGVEAPFNMFHVKTEKCVREWPNPDPTGDMPVHGLYCYQDFNNPYGIGIVKLAGGTQNVLDYMRKMDVLATMLGIKSPIEVGGDVDSADLESIVYEQDALWITGNAMVKKHDLANGVYAQLPGRISMYQTSLQKIIPAGSDMTASGTDSGDPQVSKVAASIKMQAQSLSVDIEDYRDNVYGTYTLVAQSMINIHFASMNGEDLIKLEDEERNLLMKGGLDFNTDGSGNPTNELNVSWDKARATFEWEMEPDTDKDAENQTAIEGLARVAELLASDPMAEQAIIQSGKQINRGELYSDMIGRMTDNDKIIVDIDPEDQINGMGGAIDPTTGQPIQVDPTTGQPIQNPSVTDPSNALPTGQPIEGEVVNQDDQPDDAELQAHIDMIVERYGVSEDIAATMLDAEKKGYKPEEILASMQKAGLVKAPEPAGVPA